MQRNREISITAVGGNIPVRLISSCSFVIGRFEWSCLTSKFQLIHESGTKTWCWRLSNLSRESWCLPPTHFTPGWCIIVLLFSQDVDATEMRRRGDESQNSDHDLSLCANVFLIQPSRWRGWVVVCVGQRVSCLDIMCEELHLPPPTHSVHSCI